MLQASRIDLAHAPDFSLGRLSIRPGTREVVRDGGAVEILEPRVMQVLVALARADGAVVTRDELTYLCWEGRIVGEDAINRVLSRLRRLAEGAGKGSFHIETITKVGYRLLREGAAGSKAMPLSIDRRGLLAVGATAMVAAAGAGAWVLTRRPQRAGKDAAVPPEVAPLVQQAQVGLQQDTRDSQNQAMALYRRVVAIAPDYADGWGLLGYTYGLIAGCRATEESEALKARGRAAGERALALDPGNAYGRTAIAMARPLLGNWLGHEQALRGVVADHPTNDIFLSTLAYVMTSVGRLAEAERLLEDVARRAPPNPDIYFKRIQVLAASNRIEESDRLMAEAATLYPTHFAIWFARFYTLLYSGRSADAIALAENRAGRPGGIVGRDFDSILLVARAVQSRAPADADAAMQVHMARAREGCGYAENTIQFACALGRIDDAFAVAVAYYFGRGFTVPEIRFTPEQGTYVPRDNRLTGFLFTLGTAPLRADPRFARLAGELGLERYWQQSAYPPDYRSQADG